MSAEQVPEALAEGAVVVTATRRLARALQSSYARWIGRESWIRPQVLPWPAWLEDRFRQARDFGVLDDVLACLDEGQSGALWERLLGADEQTEGLLMRASAADTFREAWARMHAWRLPRPLLQRYASEDGQVFLRLAQAYERTLDSLAAVDAAQLGAKLSALPGLDDDAPVLFAGFDSLDPVQRDVIAGLGARARRILPAARGRAPGTRACADPQQELQAIAAWARACLAQDPAARIGIVVPELEHWSGTLEGLLDEALAPARLWPGQEAQPRPWNIALGRPLADAPAVAVGLLALGLGQGAVTLAESGRVLRSPFIGGAAREGAQRARLDAWLREQGCDPVRSRQLLDGLEGARGAPACPDLGQRVAGLVALFAQGPQRRAPSAWAADFTRALRSLGWPGDAPLDSETWQTAQAWAELVDDFARLDLVVPALRFGEALARLRRMAAARRFQPETPEVPVQVIGLLETAGLEFDALWVSGLHDGILPAPLRPNPLLSPTLQREQGMPRACPETELALAGRLVQRLAQASPGTIFSYPLAQDDEPLRPSPVLARLPALPPVTAARLHVARRLHESRRVEQLADEQGPAAAGEVRGGSSLLAAQSACPFQAFALHRLRARPLETPTAGIDPRARGAFVHLALKHFWEEVGSRAALEALPPPQRSARVRGALQAARRELPANPPYGLVQIETEETAQRIEQLLAQELARADFEVLGREMPVDMPAGPLQLRGRLDRLDRTAAGLVVIDYKTGAVDASAWAGERPAEPQMPLYALALGDEVAGLVYATLRPGKVGYHGLARSAEVLGAATAEAAVLGAEQWAAQQREWRDTVDALASAFAAGDARVDPLEPTRRGGSCTYCQLATLCRRDELLRTGAIGND